ncbi:hypothetical protein [Nocardia rhizosphaerae]|uniref:Uncharacterized protein n=1 Tax=Nocardia rhizosphaerae TaxID=1691571 RepID=A0ABV8L6B5_9NOCA
MDQARIAATDEIVDATDLLAWDAALVERSDFTCPSTLCSAKLAACAWRPGQKVRPYFSARWGHAAGCDVDGRVKLVDPPERSDDPEPLEVVAGYVAKLVLSDVRRIQSPQPPADSDELESVSEPPSTPVTDQRAMRLGTCRTIRTLCSTFLHNPPELRAAMRLDVPGVDATRYATGFRRLERFEVRRYTEQRIFYAPIRWSAEPVETPRALTIDLYCGDNDPSGLLGLVNPYQLIIGWKQWSPRQRNSVTREVTHARSEGRQRYSPGSQAGCWAFFLGNQNPTDPAKFHVNDHRLVCFLAADGVHHDRQQSPWRNPGSTAGPSR